MADKGDNYGIEHTSKILQARSRQGTDKICSLVCPLILRFSSSLTFVVFDIFTNKLLW